MPAPRFEPIEIVWTRFRKKWGLADDEKRIIWLDRRMSDKKMMEIASHEVAHIILKTTDEKTVALLGKHIADVLTRIGFARNQDDT